MSSCAAAGIDVSEMRKPFNCIKIGNSKPTPQCTVFCDVGLDVKSEEPNKAQKAFWDALKNHHTDSSTVKFHNSNMTIWGQKSTLAVVETAKLFCSSLGQNAGQFRKFDDFDAEAIFNMIRHCKGFPQALISSASEHAVAARNAIMHARHPALKKEIYEKIYKGLSAFVQKLGLSAEDCKQALLELTSIHNKDFLLGIDPWQYEHMLDDHAQLREMRSKGVQSFLKHVQDMCSEVGEVVKRCLQDWPHAGSRRKLLDSIAETWRNVGEDGFRLTWMQGHRGSGKSSAVCKLKEELLYSGIDGELQTNEFVLHHSFIRSDSSSSLQVAVGSICVQLLKLLLPLVAEDDRDGFSVEIMTDLIGSFEQGLGKMEIRQLLLGRDVGQLSDVLVKLLGKLNEQTRAHRVVIFLDAIDEVFERRETAGGFENPDRTLQTRVLQRVRAGLEGRKHVTVSVVVSSTHAPPSDARCKLIRVDETSQYFSSHDIDFLIESEARKSEAPLEREMRPVWASCAIEFMKVNCPPVSDLRLLRTWVRLTFRIARMLFDTQPPLCGSLSEEWHSSFRESLAVHKVTKMDQVVQMYLGQCILTAFPDADSDAWHSQVVEAYRVLLLTAFLGVDSIDVAALEIFFRRNDGDAHWCHRTMQLVRQALPDFLIIREDSTDSQDSMIAFQPYYLDVFRRSLLKDGVDEEAVPDNWADLYKMAQLDIKLSDRLSKHRIFLFKCQIKLSKVRGLVKAGKRLLCKLEENLSVPSSVWKKLLEIAMQGASCAAISFIFRVLVNKDPNDASMPRLCQFACAAFENAINIHQATDEKTGKPDVEVGMWCFHVGDSISEFSDAVKSLFTSGLDPAIWKDSLLHIMKFLSNHKVAGKFLDFLENAGKGSYLDAALYPAYYYFCSDMLSAMKNDHDARSWWLRELATHFSSADSLNIELMSCSGKSERKAMQGRLRSICDDQACDKNGITWHMILSYSKGKQCLRSFDVMQKQGVSINDAHWGTVMRFFGRDRRAKVLHDLQSSGCAGVFVWTAVISAQRSAAEREKLFEKMIAAGVKPNKFTTQALMEGYSMAADKERVLHRMQKEHGVKATSHHWHPVISSYAAKHEKQAAFKRMVRTGLPPNAETIRLLITSCHESCRDRLDAMQRMTNGPHPVIFNTELIRCLLLTPDADANSQALLDLTKSLPDKVLCDHTVLGALLRRSAGANDVPFVKTLWEIGATGLATSKEGWPGRRICKEIGELVTSMIFVDDDHQTSAAAMCPSSQPPQQYVLVMVGPAGSGKSTLSALLKPDFHRINQSVLGSLENCRAAAQVMLQQGHSIVIDRTNLNPSQRSTWVSQPLPRRSLRQAHFPTG
jgi:hypothetical protein